MVDVAGHIAIGMLWALPAWFLWNVRTSVVFIGIVVVAALLPDLDLWINKVLPLLIHHHGVTHTVVYVVGVAVVVATVVATTLPRLIDRQLDSERFWASNLFLFVFVAMVLGGLSHLFADMLSAPDIAQPIEPLWPFYNSSISVDLVWYNSPVWNIGLLTVTVLLHVTVAYAVEPVNYAYRSH